MILNVDYEIMIDVDKISLILPKDNFIVVDGTKVNVTSECLTTLVNAFRFVHNSHMYNKDLKIEYGKGE